MEDEYRIIDFKEGEGRDAGAVIWVCETADDKEFTVRPRGTMTQRHACSMMGSHILVRT